MSNSEKFLITEREYDALFSIRGLEQSAHLMVMTAKSDSTGDYVLEGTSSTFDALARDIAEEIEFELSPPAKLKRLAKLYQRLTPDCDIFLLADN